MILDTLGNAANYSELNPGFAQAFDFLRRADIATLETGTYPVAGEEVFAMIQRNQGKRSSDARLEAHRNHIDIQFLIGGMEQIGWNARAECSAVSQVYVSEKDIEFFADKPQTYFTLRPGMFAVFFPGDAHAPMISDAMVHKCVVKVKV